MVPRWKQGIADNPWPTRWLNLRERCHQLSFQAITDGLCTLAITGPGITAPEAGFATHGWAVLPKSKTADFWLHGSPKNLALFQAAMHDKNPNAAAALIGLPDDCHWFWRECWEELNCWDYWWPAAWQTQPLSLPTAATTFWAGKQPIQISFYLGLQWPIWPVRRFSQQKRQFTRKHMRWSAAQYTSVQQGWLNEIDHAPWTWRGSRQQTTIELPFVTIDTIGDNHKPTKTINYHTADVDPSPQPRFGALSAPLPHWISEDNDFRSRLCLDQAHAVILATATRVLRQKPGPVLDLGCGNGYLLAKLQQHCPGHDMVGIEWLMARQDHASQLLADKSQIYLGDMYSDLRPWQDPAPYRLAILMAGRLTEVSPAKQGWLKEKLANHCDIILVYLYSNWLQQWRLQDLLIAVGLEPLAILPHGKVALARVAQQESHWSQGPALRTISHNCDPRYLP